MSSNGQLLMSLDIADLDALNTMLVTACRADEARVLDGRTKTIGAAMAIERGHLLSCAVEGVDLAEVVFPAGGQAGLRDGEDQPVFGAGAGGQPGGGTDPSVACRDLACGPSDCPP